MCLSPLDPNAQSSRQRSVKTQVADPFGFTAPYTLVSVVGFRNATKKFSVDGSHLSTRSVETFQTDVEFTDIPWWQGSFSYMVTDSLGQ